MRTVTPDNQYERLLESATPLYKTPYAVQLESKRKALEQALRKVINIVRNSSEHSGQMTPAIQRASEENQGQICALVDMKQNPQPERSRNKDQLVIHMGVDGNPNTVGLSIGRGADVRCVPCGCLPNMKPLHLDVVKMFEEFMAQSKFRHSSAERGPGPFWSGLKIRSNQQGHVMLVPQLGFYQFSQDLIDQAKEELSRFYFDGTQLLHGIQSLHLEAKFCYRRNPQTLEHLHGDTHIYEEVLGYKFRISPSTFFQLHTPGAEVLYTEVQNMVKTCGPRTLLDIGCGTGTISVMTSSLVDRVVGLDVMNQAVQDAEFNAELNGVTNADFRVGTARAVMKEFLKTGDVLTDDTLAVANPSRSGLNKKAIQRLRSCEAIKNVLYISCKPYGNAVVNFVDLVSGESESHPGQPFRAVYAVGVDMFPFTVHSELVLLFER